MVGADRAPVALPSRRVILLGASNIARCFSTVISEAQYAWGRPLDIMAAMGHGRAFGLESWVLGRTLPPIVECGLWQALAERNPAETAVLITDIGNDLVFGATSQHVADWVGESLSRLATPGARLAISQLPLASLERLGPRSFLLLRTVLFPRSRITFESALDRARGVNEAVLRLAKTYDAAVITPAADWYGFDPIHIRRSRQPAAWREIFSYWNHSAVATSLPFIRHSSWYLSRLRPQQRGWFGIEQRQIQPAGRLPDGSYISLY